MLKPKTALDQDMDTNDMSLIEKYIKLTISSLTPVSYTIDLSRYFLEPPAGSSNFYQRSDQSSDDPFSFASRTFTLTIDEDLSALDKDSFRVEVAYYEPEDGQGQRGPFQNITRYNIDISIFDPVSGNQTSGAQDSSITVQENQIGPIFDASTIDAGLTGTPTSYALTDGGNFVRLLPSGVVELNPDFDPDDNNTTQFTFTLEIGDGTDVVTHTVTANVMQINDEAPVFVTSPIELSDNRFHERVIITEDMIDYADRDASTKDEDITYDVTGLLPTGVKFFRYTDDDFQFRVSNILEFTHLEILEGRIGLEFSDVENFGNFTFIVSDGVNSSEPTTLILRRKLTVSDREDSTTIDWSDEDRSFNVDAGLGQDTIIGGSGDDKIKGGRGDDQIDLSNGGNDTVVYQVRTEVEAGQTYNAIDGNDEITDFDRANDTFVFTSFRENLDLNTLMGFGGYEHDFQGWRQIHWIKPE